MHAYIYTHIINSAVKRFLPFLFVKFFAYLAHLKGSKNSFYYKLKKNVNVILHKDNASKYRRPFVNDDFI